MSMRLSMWHDSRLQPTSLSPITHTHASLDSAKCQMQKRQTPRRLRINYRTITKTNYFKLEVNHPGACVIKQFFPNLQRNGCRYRYVITVVFRPWLFLRTWGLIINVIMNAVSVVSQFYVNTVISMFFNRRIFYGHMPVHYAVISFIRLAHGLSDTTAD